MLERLSLNVEGKFWKGPDLVTADSVIVYQAENIPVIVTPQSLPPLDGSHPDVLRFVHSSMRSRLAQAGLNAHDAIGEQIAQFIINGNRQDVNGSIRDKFEAKVLIFNHCARPIAVPKGVRLLRFFYEHARPVIKDKELISLINSGEIKIEGKQGVDWMWSYDNSQSHINISGVYVRIKPEDRIWIPPHPNDEPLSIDDTVVDYRQIIDSLSEPVPQDKRIKLWIGETVPITLGKSVEAILDKMVLHDPNDINKLQNLSLEYPGVQPGVQTNSRLIDGEKTNWPLRVEILSSTTPDVIPNFVHLHFLKNGHH